MAPTCVLRVRVCEPPPHVCEQAGHVAHCDWTQFTGQHVSLHEEESVSTGQPAPPFDTGVVMVRLRDLVPPPHVTVHADHASQPVTTQSTAHASVLHAMVSSRNGHV